MKKSIYFLFTIILLIAGFTCQAAEQSEIKNIYSKIKNIFEHKKQANQIQLMFFQHAPTGTIVITKGKAGCYTLVLNNLYDKVVYFANQPSRVTGSLTIPQFIETWDHNQKMYGLRPNSIIEADAIMGQGKVKTIHDVASFSDPQYDNKNHILSYKACSLESGKQLTQMQLKDINIFFDPFHRWPP